MIWRSVICFSLAAAAACAATVTGRVSLEASRDKRVQSRRDFSSVVLWLEPAGTNATARPKSARMLQRDKTFMPHVLAIQSGTAVEFPNLDPIFHNAFSNFSGQMFDVGLYPPGTSRTVRFRREGVVRVFCNIHPTMSAVIVVLDSPLFAVSAHDGSFEIGNVPPGEYTLRVFHERATDATLQSLQRRLSVGGDVELPPLAISEAGYLPLPHKNKYGKDYPRVTTDVLPSYGGAQR